MAKHDPEIAKNLIAIAPTCDKITEKELLQATDMAIEMKRLGVLGKPCPDYTDLCVSMKVVRIIQSYTNIVNRMVWRKE